jgi:hypothetical protein
VLQKSENCHCSKCVFTKGFDVAAKQGSTHTRYMCVRAKKETHHNKTMRCDEIVLSG